jgi:hypothetical protein
MVRKMGKQDGETSFEYWTRHLYQIKDQLHGEPAGSEPYESLLRMAALAQAKLKELEKGMQ